jgi:hypothetical protein
MECGGGGYGGVGGGGGGVLRMQPIQDDQQVRARACARRGLVPYFVTAADRPVSSCVRCKPLQLVVAAFTAR